MGKILLKTYFRNIKKIKKLIIWWKWHTKLINFVYTKVHL